MGNQKIIDLFAGPGIGGWDEGLRMIGRRDVLGIEWDESACMTAEAAGHRRLRADVSALNPHDYIGAEGLIASPPCQAWSLAGKRGGEDDRAACHELADRMAAGDDSTDWRDWADDRSPLVCQPVRWARELRPEWIALEEVPAVLGLWEHMARIFRAWGYDVWVGVINAADYGVPQTRKRAILMASRVRTVTPPEPTHAEHPVGVDLFGGGHREKWVSMAEALGWASGLNVNTRGNRRTSGGNEFPADRPSWALTGKTRSWFASAGVTGQGRPKDPETQPADTITGKGTAYLLRDSNQWAWHRPATTVAGDPRIADPGHRDRASGERQFRPGGIRVTVQEAGVLQSFTADYQWQGSRTKQYEAVGNAVPPLLAAHVLATVMGGPHDYIARIGSYYHTVRAIEPKKGA